MGITMKQIDTIKSSFQEMVNLYTQLIKFNKLRKECHTFTLTMEGVTASCTHTERSTIPMPIDFEEVTVREYNHLILMAYCVIIANGFDAGESCPNAYYTDLELDAIAYAVDLHSKDTVVNSIVSKTNVAANLSSLPKD